MLNARVAWGPATPRLRVGLISGAAFGIALLLSAGCSGLGPSRTTAPTPVPERQVGPPQRAPAPPAAAVPAGPLSPSAVAAALDEEQRWLRAWFRGTPVVIERRQDGALMVDVPREFCFDPGRSGVKPALAAVLDKLAQSLRRRPAVHLALLAAPYDAAGATPVGLQRAAQMRKHLRDRGVSAQRIGEMRATTAAAVQLRLSAAPARQAVVSTAP